MSSPPKSWLIGSAAQVCAPVPSSLKLCEFVTATLCGLCIKQPRVKSREKQVWVEGEIKFKIHTLVYLVTHRLSEMLGFGFLKWQAHQGFFFIFCLIFGIWCFLHLKHMQSWKCCKTLKNNRIYAKFWGEIFTYLPKKLTKYPKIRFWVTDLSLMHTFDII